MDLIEALLELERQAATVESYLPLDADPALLVELLEPWAPPPRLMKSGRSRERQVEDFLSWLRDCAARWEARPPDPHPSGEQMGALLLRWAARR
jgi:hypothetical protein